MGVYIASEDIFWNVSYVLYAVWNVCVNIVVLSQGAIYMFAIVMCFVIFILHLMDVCFLVYICL